MINYLLFAVIITLSVAYVSSDCSASDTKEANKLYTTYQKDDDGNVKCGYVNSNKIVIRDAKFDCGPIPSQPNTLKQFMYKGKIGIIDSNGNIIINPKYDPKFYSVHELNNGMIVVGEGSDSFDTKYSALNNKGETVINKVDSLSDFKGDTAVIGRYESFEYTDYSKMITYVGITPDQVDSFRKPGRTLIGKNMRYGIINIKGDYVIPLEYKQLSNFNEGLAAYQESTNKFGYINIHGETVIPAIFDHASNFVDGIARVSIGKDYCIFIDKEGNKLFKIPNADMYSCYYENNGFITFEIDKRKGLADAKGNILVQPVNEDTIYFSDKMYSFKQSKKYGFKNINNEVVVKPLYDDISYFGKGVAIVKLDGKWGVVDLTGKFIFNNEYDNIEKVDDTMWLVDKKGIRSYINNNLEVVWKEQVSKVLNAYEQYAHNRDNYVSYSHFTTSDINHDGNKEIIVIEGIDGKYVDIVLAVYKYNNGIIKLIDKKTIGFNVGFQVDEITFNKNIINIRGRKHLKNDAMCCPSGKTNLKYKLVNNKLKVI